MGHSSTKQPSAVGPTTPPEGDSDGQGSVPIQDAGGGFRGAALAELSDGDLMSLPSGEFGGGPARLPAAPVLPLRGTPDVPEPMKDPLVGKTLHDTYVVSRVLGEGGMGRVYEAHHTRIVSKRYAIKVLHSEFSRNPDIRRRFQREAEAAASIEHDGVVGTYDVGQTPQGWPYMVCEYLAGVDLNDYLKQGGALPAETVVHIGKQLCSALSAAHSRGVIHRDLKPHNVFVLRGSRAELELQLEPGLVELPAVKVLDFGLSRFVEGDNELTKTGIILGTPEYMAPEQANGRDTDRRTDIYGIGALLYTAATGRPPFKEETPQQTVLAVMSQEPPRPRDLAPSLPVDLEIVIQKAMAREPSDRYQSADEMAAALNQLYVASSPLNRRGKAPAKAARLAPRASLVLYAASAVTFGGLSLIGALVALLEIKGLDYRAFRPSLLEGLLSLLLGVLLLVAVTALLRRFKRRTWANSARVAELIPKLKRPLIAATLAYGLSALAVRLGAIVSGITQGSLTDSPLNSAALLYLVLPMNALLAASASILRDASASAKSGLVRALLGVGYSAGTLAASVILVASVFSGQKSGLTRPQGPQENREHTPTLSAGSVRPPTSRSDAGENPSLGPALGPLADSPTAESEASDPAPPSLVSPTGLGETTAGPADDANPADSAPGPDFAVAREQGTEALELLSQKYPRDSKLLKALVLAHASRADTIDRSVQAITRLLDVNPSATEDPDVLFILKKALRLKGKAFVAATSTVKKMGRTGAELLYTAINEHPDQRSRLRLVFQELRQAEQVSQELLVAYDLRYASSCKVRLQYLERAEEYGDARSLHQLQALSTAPKRCGWGRTCYPPCRAEAEAFAQSAKVISQRLDQARPKDSGP